jgi:hypothetical protein
MEAEGIRSLEQTNLVCLAAQGIFRWESQCSYALLALVLVLSLAHGFPVGLQKQRSQSRARENDAVY